MDGARVLMDLLELLLHILGELIDGAELFHFWRFLTALGAAIGLILIVNHHFPARSTRWRAGIPLTVAGMAAGIAWETAARRRR